MAAAPIIITKSPVEIFSETLDLTNILVAGASISTATIGLINPTGTLVINNIVISSPDVSLQFSGGTDGVTYGARLDITTSIGQTLSVTLAILVSSQLGNTYTIKNPEGIQTLVDQIQAGDVAVGNANFTFPVGTDLSNGYINWELLDTNGITYANGNAFEYLITNTALATKAEGRAIITVPSDVPINTQGQKYQIRWTLTLPSSGPFYAYENVTVLSAYSVPQGVEDAVEMQGDIAKLTIVLPQFYDHVGIELYQLSGSMNLVAFTEVQEKYKTADGYYCVAHIDTTTIPVALEHYIVVWKYWNDAKPNEVYRQTGRLFVTNASILSATDDVRSFIQRADTTLAHQQDLVFSVPALMTFLRMGRDHFNGAYGTLTQFDMTDATAAIRAFWIMHANVQALRAQFLAEGEKAFNFSGQSIQLDVDRTQYYTQLASEIQQQLDNECKAFKQNLIKKGIVTGTGNCDDISLRLGAIGSIALSITPASNFSRFMGKMGGSGRIG